MGKEFKILSGVGFQMDIHSIEDAPRFHAPNQPSRVARILAQEEGVAVGRGYYGKGMKALFHSHVGNEYIHVIGGTGIFRTHDKEVVAKAGQTLKFEAGEEHQLENQQDEPLEFVFVYPYAKDVDVLKERWIKEENTKKK
jgi:quercetin dioxygenase-like cupin family protein